MDTISTFFDMGGYAGFIWPSYAVVLGVLAALLWVSLRGLKSAEAELDRLESVNPRNGRRIAPDDGASQP